MHLIGIAALVTGLFAVSMVAQDMGDDMPPGSVESNLAILKDPAMMVYMPDLTMKEFFFVVAMCARDNQRGILGPADAGHSIYVSEPEWKWDGEWPV